MVTLERKIFLGNNSKRLNFNQKRVTMARFFMYIVLCLPIDFILIAVFPLGITGASKFMTNISSSLVSMLFNLQLLKYLGKNGVAAYGVLMYAQFIFIAIYFGYTVGISSILITVICEFSSPYLAQLFVGYSKELLEMTVKAFSLYCFTFLFFGLNTMKNEPRYPANSLAGS